MSSYGRVPVYDDEWGTRFTTVMDTYMTLLDESVESPDGEEMETLSGQPYDGCSECVFRESSLMAIKLALEGHEQGQVRLSE